MEIALTIKNAVKQGYIITAANFNDWNGLVAGNGYIVKNVYQVSKDQTLISLKNVFKPLSGDLKQEPWTGRFSKGHTSWTSETLAKVNFESR